MRPFNRITYFENKRRVVKLKHFDYVVNGYFKSVKSGNSYYNDDIQTDESLRFRQEINKSLPVIKSIFLNCGVHPNIFYTPPPAIGGYAHDIDLLLNIFNLKPFKISPLVLLDNIDKAIGVYENDLKFALIRTLNPLFWLFLVFESIATIPFLVLGRVGFNQTVAENSFIGRVFKFVVILVESLAAILTILTLLKQTELLESLIGALNKFHR